MYSFPRHGELQSHEIEAEGVPDGADTKDNYVGFATGNKMFPPLVDVEHNFIVEVISVGWKCPGYLLSCGFAPV